MQDGEEVYLHSFLAMELYGGESNNYMGGSDGLNELHTQNKSGQACKVRRMTFTGGLTTYVVLLLRTSLHLPSVSASAHACQC